MKIDDHRRVSSLSIALVLLAVYGLYVPHLFLTVTVIEHGALGGHVNALLYVTGMGMLFMLTLPVYGDLFFWIASVLFARRRFRGAVIVGGIGLGLCASFYCFPLIAWDLHRETAIGALSAVALRLGSMGLLVGFAWKYLYLANDDAPSKADVADGASPPKDGDQV
jgi:hypothetical protein